MMCLHCNKIFKRSYNLKRHNNKLISCVSSSINNEEYPKFMFQCSTCPLQMSSYVELDEHLVVCNPKANPKHKRIPTT